MIYVDVLKMSLFRCWQKGVRANSTQKAAQLWCWKAISERSICTLAPDPCTLLFAVKDASRSIGDCLYWHCHDLKFCWKFTKNTKNTWQIQLFHKFNIDNEKINTINCSKINFERIGKKIKKWWWQEIFFKILGNV